MDFRILGSLEVWDSERQLELGGPKRRAVLAVLLLHANEVVAADRLVDQLWGEKAPRNAAGALHTHVSRLRKELGSDVVATRAWGYVLRTDPGALDLERFEQLVGASESLPARERAGRLREALALWRGTPLEDVAFEPALATDVARLEELRLTVLENRIDADLEAGNHAGLVGELEALIAEHPLRERLRGQLILTLYRSGRQAEALEVYRETRRVLADQLGLEPSSELRELERAILQHDPALRARPSSAAIVAERGVRPGRRRRIYTGASLALLIAGLATAASYEVRTRTTHAAERQTTPTLNVEHNIHVWGWTNGAPAPSSVLHFFASIGIGAPLGMNPHVRSDDVRTFPLPEGSVVWVAPAANGGLCEDFALERGGGCDHARAFAINTSLSTVGSVRCGAPLDTVPALLAGHVNAKPGSTLQLESSNGSFSSLALTWVGPPIDAGFFEEEIPARGSGPHVTALVLRDPHGSIVAKETEVLRGSDKPRPCPNSSANGRS